MLSEDGDWFWTGSEWVPAPPNAGTLPARGRIYRKVRRTRFVIALIALAGAITASLFLLRPPSNSHPISMAEQFANALRSTGTVVGDLKTLQAHGSTLDLATALVLGDLGNPQQAGLQVEVGSVYVRIAQYPSDEEARTAATDPLLLARTESLQCGRLVITAADANTLSTAQGLSSFGCGSINQQRRPPALQPSGSEPVGCTPNGTGTTDLSAKPLFTVPVDPAPIATTIMDIVCGTGAEAQPGSAVTVKYVGVDYADGKEFDSSWARGDNETLPFSIGDGVIEGFSKGTTGMKVGGRREVIVAPADGYGSGGPVPGGTLVFIIDLVSVD